MQCNDIQEMLSAYIDGVLDEHEKSAVEDHITSCSLCSQELTALRETVKLLNSLGEVSPPEKFRSQLLQRLEAMHEEAAREIGLDDGPTLTGVRQWFGGINKYMVAAVLMIGLGIGTGLYKLDALTGSSGINLAYDLKAPLSTTESTKTSEETQLQDSLQKGKQEKSEAEPPKIDPNTPVASDSANTGTGTTSSAKSRNQVSAGSAPNPAHTEAQEPARITAADSQTTDSSMRTPAAESVQDQMMGEAPAQDTGMAETKVSAVQPEIGALEGPKPKLNSKVEESSRTYAAADKSIVSPSAAESMPSEAASHSAEVKSSAVSSRMTWWILPGALLAAGIGCAAYYLFLRRSKNH